MNEQIKLFPDMPVETSPTIVCSRCGKEKPKSEFGKNPQTKDGLDLHCNDCKAVYVKTFHEKNPDYSSKYGKRYYQEHKKSELSRALVKNYGITLEDKKEMLESQDNKCAICGEKLTLLGRGTHVDHDHETGRIRAILCNKCNAMLGNANEDIEILQKAIKYLSRFSLDSNTK
jgi:DNA-binding transcriptional MerR regulator